jgi:precorrin isomerase
MKELFIEKDEYKSEHKIISRNTLCCSDTGRVIAVFYNDYDLDAVINEIKNDKAEIVALKKMIDNGIGWEDLEDDTKPFNQSR